MPQLSAFLLLLLLADETTGTVATTSGTDIPREANRTTVVVLLFLLFIALAALLVYFCRRLNRETEGGYTLSKLLLANSSDDSGEIRGPRAWLNGALAFFRGEQGRGGEDLEAGGQDESEEGGEEEEEEREDEGRKAGTAGEEQERPPTDAENSDSDSDDYSSMEGFDPTGRANGMGGRSLSDAGEGGGKGLLVDLRDFSGSVVWTEEREGGGGVCDVTAL